MGGPSEMARSIMSAGADTFSSSNMQLANVDDLMKSAVVADIPDEGAMIETEKEKNEQAKDPEADAGGGSDAAKESADGASGKKQHKPTKWFDRETELAQAREKCSKVVEPIKASLTSEMEGLQRLLAHDEIEFVLVKGYARKAQTCCNTVEHVLKDCEDAEAQLDEHLSQYKDIEGSAAEEVVDDAASVSLAGDRDHPPCSKWQHLLPISLWESMLDELSEIRTASDLKEFSKDFPKPKVALQDLINATKKARVNLARVLKERDVDLQKKRAASRASGQAAQSSTKAANAALEAHVETPAFHKFDFLLEYAGDSSNSQHTLTSRSAAELETCEIAWSSPFLITAVTDSAALSGTNLQSALEFQKQPFLSMPSIAVKQGGSGRGQVVPKSLPIKEAIGHAFDRMMGSHYASQEVQYDELRAADDVDKQMQDNMSGVFFGICKDTEHAVIEKGLCGSLRYATGSSSRIFLISMLEMSAKIAEFHRPDSGDDSAPHLDVGDKKVVKNTSTASPPTRGSKCFQIADAGSALLAHANCCMFLQVVFGTCWVVGVGGPMVEQIRMGGRWVGRWMGGCIGQGGHGDIHGSAG